MQIPPASFTSVASGAIGATANAQKMQSTAPTTEAATVTSQDVAELSHGDADRDAQGQGDGLPGKRGNQGPKEPESQEILPTSGLEHAAPPPSIETGGLDLWG